MTPADSEQIADLRRFIVELPKAELHLHIEGTLEPEMLFAFAARNGARTTHATVSDLHSAYDFDRLQSFLDIYYEGAGVMQTAEDFFDLTWAYLERAARDGVTQAEIFFDPQTHTARGIGLDAVIGGITSALDRSPELGITSGLILCFLRHLSGRDAVETLEAALPWRSRLLGVGLDSSEVGHPPSKFIDAYDLARSEGLRLVAHAGEEGPAEYIWEALDVLGVERIDHGVRAVEDSSLMRRLAVEKIPLTVCPLSNLKLRVVDDLIHHPLRTLIDAGVMVTINSDDPAYFGGYVADNYVAIADSLDLTRTELEKLAADSLSASFNP